MEMILYPHIADLHKYARIHAGRVPGKKQYGYINSILHIRWPIKRDLTKLETFLYGEILESEANQT